MSRPPVYLLTGSEELLLHRAAERLLADLRGTGSLDVTDVRAADLREAGLPDLRTGSLFGDPRALVIRAAEELPAPASADLLAQLEGPPPEATVILLATSTGRIQKLARRVKALGGRVDIAPPREWEERRWADLVTEELARHGRRAERQALQALLDHAGLDVSAIAEKSAQVARSASPGTITAAQVEQVVVGHGSRGSFAVADAMCDRRPDQALTLLRGALESGNDPVLILGALTYRLRSLVAVAGRLEPRSIGLPLSPGQARRLQGVRRNFGPGELTRAYRVLADADAEIKGGELPAELVIERAVVAIATRD
ncbi:MAG: DNA polymerase III subunit delta [Egibacteraceae bacterium]